MPFPIIVYIILLLAHAPQVHGQLEGIDLHADSLPRIERALMPVARTVLQDTSYARKLAMNQRLTEALRVVLQRPDSYDYAFDSLSSISRLYPADQSFRIFTWQIVQHDDEHFFREHSHFGFVQRKFYCPDSSMKIIVIPLEDKTEFSTSVEAVGLTNKTWLGALYYKPEYSEYGVLSFDGTYQTVNTLTNRTEVNPVRYYILLGFNGYNLGSNLKMIEALFFDPIDSTKVHFGVPIFTVSSLVQKYRMVFKYADNSPFSLNQRIVITGRVFKRKRMMLVFDHLVRPQNARPTELDMVGTDGTTDAVYWLNRVVAQRRGFFLLVPNVQVYDPSMEGYSRKELNRQLRRERQRLRKMGVGVAKFRRDNNGLFPTE